MRTRGKRWRHAAAAVVIAGAASRAAVRWLRRAGHRRRVVDLRMTVVVERPISEVFAFCRDFEHFPELVNVLEQVEDHQDGRSHWVVRAPGGSRIEWDAVVTKYVPNSVIAWESVATSPVRASGLMRFAPLGSDATRLDMILTYRPNATAVADALRALATTKNSTRLRAELARASAELGRLGGTGQTA
jgi:uncharacterized membrane protein